MGRGAVPSLINRFNPDYPNVQQKLIHHDIEKRLSLL
jgi:hypothetical protein